MNTLNTLLVSSAFLFLFTGCNPPPQSAEVNKIVEMINDDDLPWSYEKLRTNNTIRLAHIDVTFDGYVYYDRNYNYEYSFASYRTKIREAVAARIHRDRLQRLNEATLQGLEQKLKLLKNEKIDL